MTTEVENRPAQQQDQDQQDSQSGDQGQGAMSGLSATLQQQIADAIAPVMDDLQQQITEAVRQQVQRSQGAQVSDEDVKAQVDEALEPMRQNLQDQVTQGIQEAQQEKDSTEQSPLQQAIRQTVRALKQTLQWLARTLKDLLQTVKALLTAVVRLLQVIVIALGQGLGFALSPLRGALNSAMSGLWDRIKSLVSRLLHWFVDKLPMVESSEEGNQEEDAPKEQQTESESSAA